MKKFALFSLLTASVLMITPKPAVASDKGLAILGGVVGGLIIANSLDHHNVRSSVVVSSGSGYRDSGYWHDSPYNFWVEGCWVVSYDRFHRRHRHFNPGYYETRVRRVWVSSPRRDHRDHREYRHGHREHRRHSSYPQNTRSEWRNSRDRDRR